MITVHRPFRCLLDGGLLWDAGEYAHEAIPAPIVDLMIECGAATQTPPESVPDDTPKPKRNK